MNYIDFVESDEKLLDFAMLGDKLPAMYFDLTAYRIEGKVTDHIAHFLGICCD